MSRRETVAVIDIGSNSGRVMVFERDASNHLRPLAGSRAPLRLVHDVDQRAELSEATMARTMEALRDFQAIAESAGATRVVAVATAAMRDANNASRFTERVQRELGIGIEIIGALTEARLGFVGAVRGLSVSNGILFDLGGGSIQVTRFASRRMGDATSLPLGALRLSEKFLTDDPPTRKQLRRLRDHVRTRLKADGVGRLRVGDRLVGTGGTFATSPRSIGRLAIIRSAAFMATSLPSITWQMSPSVSPLPSKSTAMRFLASAPNGRTQSSVALSQYTRWRNLWARRAFLCRVRAYAKAWHCEC